MTKQTYDYDNWINKAFIEVAKKALATIQANDNLKVNIYISFFTNHFKTKISKDVLANYPEQITIVLENDFHNLQVQEDGFIVNLSFNGIREDIFVPFTALISFYDTINNISLEFKQSKEPKNDGNKPLNKSKIIKFTPKD